MEIGRLGWRFANLPDVLGDHVVHAQSYFLRTTKYQARQQRLAQMQTRRSAPLAWRFWMRVYPLGRRAYWTMPDSVERIARRTLVGSREQDVSIGEQP
jgi:hypothetical protein